MTKQVHAFGAFDVDIVDLLKLKIPPMLSAEHPKYGRYPGTVRAFSAVTTGMGNVASHLDAAPYHGIVVSGTGGLGHPTAELLSALILVLVRHLVIDEGARGGRR